MTFSGTGTTTLTAIEGYTGPTTVNSGTLAIAYANNTTNGSLRNTSGITINSGGTVSLGGADNSIFGYKGGGSTITINAGGLLATATSSYAYHLGSVILAGGTLASAGTPTGDASTYGFYALDGGVVAGGVSATSVISAQDMALTESGGDVFNVSPGASSGIDLYVTGYFGNPGGSAANGLIKTGNGVMVLAGSSNYSNATTISGGTLGIIGGSLSTTGVTVSGSATLTLASGTITTGTVQIATGGFFYGYGAINGALLNQGTVTVDGTLTVNGNFQNNGYLLVTGSGRLVANLSNNGTFVNNGTLDIMDSPQTVLPPGYVNNGTILNSSLVTVQQVARTVNNFSVTIQSYTNHIYQLERSTDIQHMAEYRPGAVRDDRLRARSHRYQCGRWQYVYQIGVGP